MSDWEIYAVKYAERNARIRADSFIDDPHHDVEHHMDYFIWVLRREGETILVDTGYEKSEADRRGRPISMDPREALKPLGIAAADVDKVIVTHLHYDHAGGLALFPNAKLYLQEAEMAFATGPCMCDPTIVAPFTADHVCEAVKRVYSGKVEFINGDAEIADGLTLHCIGGHSKGLQSVRVRTEAGYLCLASDAAHYYENVFAKKLFPIVVDRDAMLAGFERLKELATKPELIIPGHDPLVRAHFPSTIAPHIFRLDKGPIKDFEL
jgi:glyoxylase-like metal-dependent hydrolase (beta-lactamase superfamily II)